MPAITNLGSLRKKLDKLADKYRPEMEETSVVVGYTANYAIWVHERSAKHKPGKQWKFLEEPARKLRGTLGSMVGEATRKGAKMIDALYLVGLRLQRDSQLIVPVDTGNLRGSAFTAREKDLQSIMATSEGQLLERMQRQGERRRVQVEKNRARREKDKAKRQRQRERDKAKVDKVKARNKKLADKVKAKHKKLTEWAKAKRKKIQMRLKKKLAKKRVVRRKPRRKSK